jgi:hypothetical protein
VVDYWSVSAIRGRRETPRLTYCSRENWTWRCLQILLKSTESMIELFVTVTVDVSFTTEQAASGSLGTHERVQHYSRSQCTESFEHYNQCDRSTSALDHTRLRHGGHMDEIHVLTTVRSEPIVGYLSPSQICDVCALLRPRKLDMEIPPDTLEDFLTKTARAEMCRQMLGHAQVPKLFSHYYLRCWPEVSITIGMSDDDWPSEEREREKRELVKSV